MGSSFSDGFSSGLGLGQLMQQKSAIAGAQDLQQQQIDLQSQGQSFNQNFASTQAGQAQSNFLLGLNPEQIDLLNAKAAQGSGQSFSGLNYAPNTGGAAPQQPSQFQKIAGSIANQASAFNQNQAARGNAAQDQYSNLTQQRPLNGYMPGDGQLPPFNSNAPPQGGQPPGGINYAPSNAKITIGNNGLRYSGTVGDAIQDAQHPVIGPYIQNSLGKTLASVSDGSDAGAVPAQMAPQASPADVNPALAYNQNLPTGGMPQSPLAIQNMVRQQRMQEAAAQLNWMKEQADVQYKQAEGRAKLAEMANTRGTTIAKLAKDAADNPDVAEYYNALMQTAGDDTGLPKSIPAIKSKLNQPTLQIPRDQADSAGIPAEIPNPYQGLPRDDANKMRADEFKKFQEESPKDRKSAVEAKNSMQLLDRFEQLNQANRTGIGYSVPGSRFFAGQGVREMTALSDRMALLAKPESLQRLTNFDLQILKGTVPSSEYPMQVNNNIATGLRVNLQNQIDWNNFKNNYFSLHKTLGGGDAENQFQEYIDRNPVYASDATKSDFKLNPNWMPAKQYFGFKNSGIDNPNDFVQQHMTDAKANANQPVPIGSRGEWNALPSGSPFIYNGQVGIKK